MKHASQLEFKDIDGSDPVAAAIAELTQEFSTFKTKQDGRLDDLEKKQIADIMRRIDDIAAKAQRPGATVESKEAALELEKKAVRKFILSGNTMSLDADELKTLNLGSPTAGGNIVAPEFSRQIIEKLTEVSPIRQLASKITISTTEIDLPTETGAVDPEAVTETGTRQPKEPTFGKVNIKAFEDACYVPFSVQLMEDSAVDLYGFLVGHVRKRFAKYEGGEFVNGAGTAGPSGILKTPSDFDQVAAAQAGTDLVDKLIELYYELPTAYAANGVWLMHRRTVGMIRKKLDNASKGTMWSDSLAAGTPARLLGAPVYEAADWPEFVSADSPPTDTYPIMFADVGSMYQIVDRVGVSMLRDPYSDAVSGIERLHFRRRVGGKVVLPEAAVLMKATA